jgi:hypothetical protein
MQAAHKRKCLEILETIKSPQYNDRVFYFVPPIRDVFDDTGWAEYTSEIEYPRDLTSIEQNLQSDSYASLSAFCKDVDLCFENAKRFNKTRYKHVSDAAAAMQKVNTYIHLL